MTHLTQSLSFLSEYVYKINVWLDDMIREYKREKGFRDTINELKKLSDSELRDIGINRGEIYDVARNTHYREER